jgi:integrase
MALAMTRPYKHSKTGVYWLRKVVPEVLRAAIGKRELVQSLGTKDPKEARAKAPAVIAAFEAVLEAARAGGDRLTLKEITALCGEWYRAECELWGDDPDQVGDLDIYEDLLHDQIERSEDEDRDPTREAVVKLTPQDRVEAAALLKAHRYPTDPATMNRLARAIFDMRFRFIAEMKRRLHGDWTPDKTLAKFPALVLREAPETAPKLTFQALVAAWAAESGTAGKALYDRQRTANLLSTFLRHDDAARVTADDVVRWKEARLAAGRSTKTVANDIGELRPIWNWGRLNRKLAFAENPFAGLAPRTKKRGRRVRGPYTEDEARQLLTAAHAETDASLRWLPWVLCFTGARLGEITQAVREDIQREGGGPWFIHIHAEGEGRTLKTVHSERMVPLHPSLIAEGFLRYVEALPAGASLFGDLRPDTFGTLKGTATKKHGRWVRRTVGIIDKTKDPAHAWRHRFEDQARRAGVPQNVTDALLGHFNPMNESESYGRGFRFMPDATAQWVDRMASPMSGPPHVPSAVPNAALQPAA